ncbi:MAG: hypothetical protein IT214_07700 [Chitinophagaceae bacterium]|jgi:hypothetical protein|nr:hypothetical protein [Chitinophagaceae bacterium]OQY92546.1 MAG: hypothetical protein B6D37_14740 [Sphingobacteriales bacterium UTBCD1]
MYHHPQRDLLVLVRQGSMSRQAMNNELTQLSAILRLTELPHNFCTAHELVSRNRITANFNKILKAASQIELKAFHFLINKN